MNNLITLTYSLPHTMLNPNNRPNEFSSKRAHRIYRERVKMRRRTTFFATVGQVRTVGLPDNLKWKDVMAEIVWYAKTLTILDADNALASLKSTIDGIADSGLILNDRYVSYAPMRFEKDKDEPRVVITLTEMDSDGKEKA